MREVWAPSLSKRWLFWARGKGRRDSRIEPRAERKFRRCGVGRAAREREAERSGGEKAREGRRRAGGERQGRAAGGPEREAQSGSARPRHCRPPGRVVLPYGACPVLRWMLNSIPASTRWRPVAFHPPAVTMKNVPKTLRNVPKGQNYPQSRATGLEE